MATLTKANLLDAVAAKIDLLSSDLTASESQIQEWAEDCLRWLLPLAPEYAVMHIAQNTTDEADGVLIHSAGGISQNCIKILRVATSDGDLCKYVEPHRFTYIKNAFASGSDSFGEGFRIWSNVMGRLFVFRLSGTPETLTVDYLDAPAWSGDDLTVPNGWDGLVASYCVVQAQMKDEEPAKAKRHWDKFMQELSRWRDLKNVARSVGG